ncbi:Mu transposase C-terminal domain-containing protein [Phormidesmis sp. 146-33]
MQSNNNEQSEQNLLSLGSSFRVDVDTISTRLVSSLDRCRILGYPTVYTVLDCSNKLVAGFSVCFGKPNFAGVILALQSAISNKMPFCQEFGIEITESEWPCYHIPDFISVSSDAAILSPSQMSYLSQTFGVGVFGVPPHRSPWRDVIERYFPIANTQVKAAGILSPLHQEYNHSDSRLDAKLSFNEFRKMVLRMVLYYNNQFHQTNLPVTHPIEGETTGESPIEKWNWASRPVAQSRITNGNSVELNLLPVAEAAITDQGVLFNGLVYICEPMTREQQIIAAKLERPRRVTIAYNPQKVDQIYLKLGDGERVVECHLASQSDAFQGLCWHEVHDYQNHDAE